ncbi:MAG TPA: ABC transporter ATP-binding protein [Candidatus Angelobacter sp.]|jgi:putative ABC transport system ATP-binding protein|nr:ABC transporter ATP-binding protein [Candidatus Angelobacter sp.]
MSGAAVLELVDVVKEYPSRPPVAALAGVDLRVEAGELVAVTGRSGSGKSTLLHIAGALERATRGLVRLGGDDVAGLPDRALSAVRARRIGFVFQQFHLLGHLDVVDNVATGLLYRGVGHRQRREAAVEVLERVGMGHRIGHRPDQLSGGERQRVAIARAVVGEPDVVFADEPTGNLDSTTGTEIVDLLLGLNASGTTVVVITHDGEVAARMQRRVELRDGRIVADEAGR